MTQLSQSVLHQILRGRFRRRDRRARAVGHHGRSRHHRSRRRSIGQRAAIGRGVVPDSLLLKTWVDHLFPSFRDLGILSRLENVKLGLR